MTYSVAVGNGGAGSGGNNSLPVKINNIPVTEAEADANTFVTEFDGETGTHETGVGGGQTDLNLVVSQFGNVPGAIDGGRNISATSGQYFMPTADALFDFFSNPSGMTVIKQCSHLTTKGYLGYLQLRNGLSQSVGQIFGEDFSRTVLTHLDPVTMDTAESLIGICDPELPLDNIFWHITSFDFINNVGFAGLAIKDTLPTALSDFLGPCVFFNARKVFNESSVVIDSNNSAIFGIKSGGTSALYKCRSLSLSKISYIEGVNNG